MIPQIHKQGSHTLGLLYYLYGKGTHEEHIDPHLVASFDGMSPDPGRDATATKQDLAQLLNQPLHLLAADQRPEKHVWHCSVRAAPDDPILSDEQWADIARRIVAATGIDPNDGAGCRWAAVRHADDHIHIVATLVREDGRRPDHHRSGKRAQAEARLIETEFGLHQVAPGDGTAAQRPTSAERHKAKRQGRERTTRETLRETVRRAVTGARSDEEFFARLAAAGLLIRKRTAPSGDLLGYKVALHDDLNKDGEPVFYPGARLAPDLSLPRIRERWSGDPTPDQEDPVRTRPSTPAAARRATASAAWQAVLVVEHGDDAVAAAHIAAAGEVLDALAATSAAHTRRELHAAATAFERASRSHVRAVRGHDRALRQAARDLVHGGTALGRGEDGASTAMAIDMLFFLITVAAHWHARKGHAQQAQAAARAAEHLRTAYQPAAAQPLGVLHARGRRLSRPVIQRQTALLRDTLPGLAERILAEPGWYALAATIAEAEAAGHDPAALLSNAVERRELDTADQVSDVLVWRLRRTADLPADASALPEKSTAGNRNTKRGSTTRPSTSGRRRNGQEAPGRSR
ncbi:relaxase/mobilization nuclease-like protein [Streptomyces sp. KhCrAH-43]|uniref:relaxase/mobilization nuclease domain-containing protein n=1 Tax=unclassified Streptomyces TaxID=2593676 RepID=UPI0003A1B864|nr:MULTISPECIES: relaxase/mobilization nuclease domain-containing protein [unclassified Streptomyces]MYS36776.1 relaxase/mobilization nuclease domain-containing protein [Streptomyces sp. SID4920]MYX69247.1 relaxase/mobilization nuclease domain-containing protein [Streptomyces sp. SID8373]RAJ62099.1 relaxase/mobilization nuclease-like protein [Streptomyces sp. KhCrAH-43]